jgi:hypothetical protein
MANSYPTIKKEFYYLKSKENIKALEAVKIVQMCKQKLPSQMSMAVFPILCD